MPQALNGAAKTGNGRNSGQKPTISNQLGDSVELSRALDTSRLQLVAAQQQQVDLVQQCSSLTEKLSTLEVELAKATEFAHYDELTGMPNRRLLLDRFGQAAALANRHRQLLALLFFDVNDFKHVNDKLGHDAGDKLLQQVATRLSSSIRKSDTACRYGGDEFVVLLTEIADQGHLLKALKKIRANLAPPYVIDRHSLRLGVSDGLAIYPEDGLSFIDLMQLADRSMFSNKSGNKRQSGGAPISNIGSLDTLDAV